MKKILFLALMLPLFITALHTCNNDVDGGNNPSLYGDCTDIAGPHHEYCLDSTTLVEYYCPTEGAWGVVCQKEEVICSGACIDGACVAKQDTIAPTQNPAITEGNEKIINPTNIPKQIEQTEVQEPIDLNYLKFVLFGLIIFVGIVYLASTILNKGDKKKKISAPKHKKKKSNVKKAVKGKKRK